MSLEIVPYVKSKTLYALDPSTFKIEMGPGYGANARPSATFTIDAVWTVTKKGTSQVCWGSLHHTEYQIAEAPSYEFFLAHADSRYGGRPDCRWDGTYMWAPETPLATMVEYAEYLNPILHNLPQVPPGFEGWYLLK